MLDRFVTLYPPLPQAVLNERMFAKSQRIASEMRVCECDAPTVMPREPGRPRDLGRVKRLGDARSLGVPRDDNAAMLRRAVRALPVCSGITSGTTEPEARPPRWRSLASTRW